MKKEIDIEIGQRIRRKREALGFSREAVAEKAELSPTFLSDIELGNKSFSAATLKKLCRVLGLSADYILFGSESKLDYIGAAELLSGLDSKYQPQAEALLGLFTQTILLAENKCP